MLTSKQDNRLTAAENTLAALQLDAQPYQHDQAVQDVVDELLQFITALQPLRAQGLRSKSKGVTSTKTDRRGTLATAAGEVAGDLYAYASKQQDRTLQATANVSYGTLLPLRPTALTDAAQAIHASATAHAAALTKYGVTKERLQELQDAIDAFSGSKNEPRQHISEGKAARLAIKAKFADLAALLEDRLDRSLRKYARSHPEFYQRVLAARKVINRPGKQKSSPETPAKQQ
jgi:hypothetical protein